MVADNVQLVATLKCQLVNLVSLLADKMQNGVDCEIDALRCEIAKLKLFLLVIRFEDDCNVKAKTISELVHYYNNLIL